MPAVLGPGKRARGPLPRPPVRRPDPRSHPRIAPLCARFLMDKRGRWSLAPAFDLTWAFAPEGLWTARHQMSVNGKRDGFERADLEACARSVGLARGRWRSIHEEVALAVARWPEHAVSSGVPEETLEHIGATHRLLA